MADNQLVTIGWLKEKGYTVLATADDVYCITYEEVTGASMVTGASCSATCYGTGAAYTNNQNVVEKDIYSAVTCACDGAITLSTTSISWAYSAVTAHTSSSVTVTINDQTCVTSTPTVSVDETGSSLCSASISDNTITITPSGTTGSTNVVVSYTSGSESCTVKISCTFNDASCQCSSITITSTAVTFVASGETKTVGSITSPCNASCGTHPNWITFSQVGTSLKLIADPNTVPSSRTDTCKISVGGSECSSITVTQDAAVVEPCPSQSDVLVGFAGTIGKDGGYSVQIGRFKNNVTEFETTSITISEGSEYASIVGTGTTWPDDSSWNVIQVSFQPNTSTSTRDIKIKLEGIRSTDICDEYELKITQSAWDGCPSFSDVVCDSARNPITGVTIAGGVGCEGDGCSGFLWFKTGDTAFSSTGSVTPDGTVVTGASFGNSTYPDYCFIVLKFKANNTNTDKNGSVIIKMNNTAGGECSYTVPVTLKAVSVPGGIIRYYSPTKLNVTLTDFTPRATAETFSNGVGQIEFESAPTGIGNKAFSGKTAMTGIDIPDSITSIGNSAFTQCTSLTAITIPYNVAYINDYLLYNCTSLSSVTLENSLVQLKPYSISNCPNLRKIEMTSVKAYPSESQNALVNSADCPIYVPEGNLVRFWGASSTSFPYKDRVLAHISYNSVVYKSAVKLTGDSLGNAYAGATNTTTKLSILSHTYDSTTQIGKITYNKAVGSFHDGTFDSKSIEYIILPENIKRIGQEVFQSCTHLRSIYFPDSVVGLCNSTTDHGSAAFNNCLALKTVVAGSGLTQIGESCFNIGGDATVTGFTFYSTTPPTLYHENSFEHVGNSKIYVPCGQVSTYKSANIWGNKSNITNRIEAIPPCTS